jgi:hypothetical protein
MSFTANVIKEITELRFLGTCSDGAARMAIANVTRDPKGFIGMSVSEAADLAIELANTKISSARSYYNDYSQEAL